MQEGNPFPPSSILCLRHGLVSINPYTLVARGRTHIQIFVLWTDTVVRGRTRIQIFVLGTDTVVRERLCIQIFVLWTDTVVRGDLTIS